MLHLAEGKTTSVIRVMFLVTVGNGWQAGAGAWAGEERQEEEMYNIYCTRCCFSVSIKLLLGALGKYGLG